MRYIRRETVLALLLVVSPLTSRLALGAQKGCETAEASQSYIESFDATIESARAEIKSNEAIRQAAIDQKTRALIADGTWKEEDQQTFFNKIRASKAFQDLERQKVPHLNKFQFSVPMITGLKTKRPMGACEFAKDAISALTDIAKINRAQYDLMESSLPKSKI